MLDEFFKGIATVSPGGKVLQRQKQCVERAAVTHDDSHEPT